MGLSAISLISLRTFVPSSLVISLEFFEFLKYDTKNLRSVDSVSLDDLFDLFSKLPKIKKRTNSKSLRKDFNDLIKKLDSSLLAKSSKDTLSEIKWKKIDDFCNLLRLIERSDERKTRWALYHLFNSGKQEITKNEIISVLGDVKISNLDKSLKKIVKVESVSGFNCKYENEKFVISHELGDKLVGRYLADAIEETSRRSPGELEDEILDLVDEGSYSNQEIAKALLVDEAMVSRSISKLREEDKIVLSSFGQRGTRYYITNCDNCPFGTTKDSCRKEALSYIINAFNEDFGIDLNATDFDNIESNQAILKIQRIVMMARKDKDTKLERSVSENLSNMLARIVDKYLEVETTDKKNLEHIPKISIDLLPMTKLPMLYQLGLIKGAKSAISLMDEMLRIASKSIKKDDRMKIRKQAYQETNKFLKTLGLKPPSTR